MTSSEMDAIAAVTNIENALLQFEVFPSKAFAAIAHVDWIIKTIEDGGIENYDRWRHEFYVRLLNHLFDIAKPEREAMPIEVDEEEPTITEPEEGDYVTHDHLKWYQYGKLVIDLPPECDDCNRVVLAHMEEKQFWPHAWFISDHDNAHLIDLTKD